MISRSHLLAVLITFAILVLPTAAQSSRVIGGGCPNRTPLAVSGPLKVATSFQIDATGCTRTPHSTALVFFGAPLPQSAWIPIRLLDTPAGRRICHVAVLPAVGVDLTSATLPVRMPIPNDPNLRGAKIGLQSFCRECAFAGCFDVLTQAIEITIG